MKVQELLQIDIFDTIPFDTEEEREEFRLEYADMFFDRLITRVQNIMSEEEVDEINAMLEAGRETQDIFMRALDFVPNLPEVFGEEFIDLKQDAIHSLQETL